MRLGFEKMCETVNQTVCDGSQLTLDKIMQKEGNILSLNQKGQASITSIMTMMMTKVIIIKNMCNVNVLNEYVNDSAKGT